MPRPRPSDKQPPAVHLPGTVKTVPYELTFTVAL